MTSPVEYLQNPVRDTIGSPIWPNATEDEQVAWYVRAKADAVRQNIPIGKVAWLYRHMFGDYPTARVAKRASKIRKAAERT